MLDLAPAVRGRALVPGDAASVARLRDGCTTEEWDHGGSDPETAPAFGCFDAQGDLLALAGYKTWGEEIAHLSIFSARDHRGRGFGRAAVAWAARHALDAGLLPPYRTLVANGPSMGIATRLGFERYGFSVFVRLRV
jgi:GNAT superfamily N-acetyltransferase